MLERPERGRRSTRLDIAWPGRGLCRQNVQIANAAVLHPSSHVNDCTRPGEAEISDAQAAPAQKAVVLLAQNGSPDPLGRHA